MQLTDRQTNKLETVQKGGLPRSMREFRVRGSFFVMVRVRVQSAKRVLGSGSFENVIVDGKMSLFPIACMIHFQLVVY